MDRFKQLMNSRHQEAKKLKENGHKLIGYFCSYCPEEIIYAAGMVPLRIFDTPSSYPRQTKHLQSYYCAHCHGCLEAGLRGEYDYLDGMIFPYACDHTRSVYESWRVNRPLKYTRFIDMPSQVDTSLAKDFFVEELKSFTSSLETAFQVKITKDKIAEGIVLCNENRRLLRQLFQLKASNDSPVSGIDTFYAILSSTISTKSLNNELLRNYLQSIYGQKVDRSAKTRLMVMGTELHNDKIISYIEDNGGFVATDELCTGTRYIWRDVDPQKDVFEAIAERYLRGVNCPLKRPGTYRYDHIANMLDAFKIEGAVLLHPKNCDPLSWDEPFIKRILEQKGIPYLFLETETDQTMKSLADNLKTVLKS